MKFNKNGILSSSNIYEGDACNLVLQSQILNTYSYVPSTSTNSCIYPGWEVLFEDCIAGEKLFCLVDVKWSGFDTSNTNGTFDIRFQGDNYKVSTGSYAWEGANHVCSALNTTSLKTLVLSSTSGTSTIVSSVTVPSTYPGTYSKSHVGLRSDYSNGTGRITLSNLRVIKEKYYVPKSYDGNPSLHIGKDYISSGAIYEI